MTMTMTTRTMTAGMSAGAVGETAGTAGTAGMSPIVRSVARVGGTLCRRLGLRSDAGMSTAEYAVGTIAAAALAAVLYTVVTGSSVVAGISAIVTRALTVNF